MINYFAPRFKELRIKNGLTKKQLAEILHCSPRTVTKYEEGKTLPKVTFAVNVAEYFKVTFSYLIGFEENFKSKKQPR